MDCFILQKNEIFYFHSFGVEHIPEEIKEFIDLPLQNKNIIANIFRLQANDSVICGYFCIGFIDFMLVGKKLTDYTSLFSPHDLKKKKKRQNKPVRTNKISIKWNNWNWKLFFIYYSFITNYLLFNQRKSCSKQLDKYFTASDYIDKILVVFSATSSGVSIISFPSIVGAPAGIASAIFTLIFSLTIGIVKKLLTITRNKKKKHDKILMLAKTKLNSIETLISQALTDMEISHE